MVETLSLVVQGGERRYLQRSRRESFVLEKLVIKGMIIRKLSSMLFWEGE